MKTDIRTKTGMIIRKDGEYLVGTICYSTDLRWSISPWDAWITRDREKARKLARITGGIVMLFNPIIGEAKVL